MDVATDADPVRSLLRLYERSGCVRMSDPARRARDGDLNRKVVEVRLAVASQAELEQVRAWLEAVGLKPAAPFRAGRGAIQPVYGRAAVEWFWTRLPPPPTLALPPTRDRGWPPGTTRVRKEPDPRVVAALKVLEPFRGRGSRELSPEMLASRRRAIMSLVDRGLPRREMAVVLGISRSRVEQIINGTRWRSRIDRENAARGCGQAAAAQDRLGSAVEPTGSWSPTWFRAPSMPPMRSGTTMPRASGPHLEARIEWIRESPSHRGRVDMIVRRPAVDVREILTEAVLDPDEGLVGDSWCLRPGWRAPDGAPRPDMQVTLMNARVAALVAGRPERWALAGDQLYVDLNLSAVNLPPGARLRVGSAILEVSDQPHRGCKKFATRFGAEALRFVNSDIGAELNLRGINALVISAGTVRTGDAVSKILR